MARKLTTKEIIESFKTTHGERYNYSNVDYIGTHTKVEIICKDHGSFFQIPKDHKKGFGCGRCAGKTSYSQKEFFDKVNEVHESKYTYLSPYTKANDKITIMCKDHGIFKQTAYTHMGGSGCNECGLLKQTGRLPLKQDEVIKRFKEVHGDVYDYSKVNYINGKTKVEIICKEHGSFNITTDCHKKGARCTSCVSYGFDLNEPAILYYIKVFNGLAYKIGITNRTVIERFSNDDLKNMDTLKTWVFNTGREAKRREDEILKEYGYAKYTGENLLKNGNSELFDRDVLGLDELSPHPKS